MTFTNIIKKDAKDDKIQPTVDKPTRGSGVTARWVFQSTSNMSNVYMCSECGRVVHASSPGLSNFPYCHCGAHMKYESGVFVDE